MRWTGLHKLLLVLLLLCASSARVSAEDARQLEQEMTILSSSISARLIDLKKNSAIVTEQLTMLSESLTASQQEAQQWKEQSTRLSSSLESINDELTSSFETITRYEHQLKKTKSTLHKLIVVFSMLILLKIAGYILYAKGIKVPRWLDILI